jgi:hypothetical protein
MRCGGFRFISYLYVFTLVHIREMRSLSFGSQDDTEGFIDVQQLPEGDEDRSKHVGIMTNCV